MIISMLISRKRVIKYTCCIRSKTGLRFQTLFTCDAPVICRYFILGLSVMIQEIKFIKAYRRTCRATCVPTHAAEIIILSTWNWVRGTPKPCAQHGILRVISDINRKTLQRQIMRGITRGDIYDCSSEEIVSPNWIVPLRRWYFAYLIACINLSLTSFTLHEYSLKWY